MEYDAFSLVTRELVKSPRECADIRTISAISRNNELWTFLGAALADPSNQLRDDLKSGLMSLSAFVLRHGHNVLVGRGNTNVLIDINMAIMRGLRGVCDL
ncbi:hypothetical protein GL286_00015 [Paracoccus aestuariivivens]|uniref:Flagellar biosynthesis regulator FlaF n=2 Tax=Paracoccus aestuariivivens TaxID=1820333 RepID=A0A6L6J688_9RHOB|nr:hypothetical protein [Paracoccus aestuariivivens]